MDDHKIEIPLTALEAKPWFTKFPDESLIEEIREHIRTTGEPHTWRGHTHTKPPVNSEVEYVAEFEVPRQIGDYRAPCPICSPWTPKFIRGMVAWFPGEMTIRLIGHECFSTLNSDGHHAAKAKFHKRQQEKLNREYLLKHIASVPFLLRTTHETAPIAEKCDLLRTQLIVVNQGQFAAAMRIIARDGQLKLNTLRIERVVTKALEEIERTVRDTSVYANLKPLTLLSTEYQPLAPRISQIRQTLLNINVDKSSVNSMSEQERAKAAKALGRAHTSLKDVVSEVIRARELVHPVTARTLQRWGEMTDAEVPIFFEVSGLTLKVGLRSWSQPNVIQLGKELFYPLQKVQELDKVA